MSTEACPHCHEKVDPTDDGCDTERCRMRRAFIRQQVSVLYKPSGYDSYNSGGEWIRVDHEPINLAWAQAKALWDLKPEGC
jgi:hypothetical protein